MKVQKGSIVAITLLGGITFAFSQEPTHLPGQENPPNLARAQVSRQCLNEQDFIDQYGPSGVLASQPTNASNNPKGVKPHSMRPVETWGTNRTVYITQRAYVPGAPTSYNEYTPKGWVYNAASDSDFRRSLADAFICSLSSGNNKDTNLERLKWYLEQNDKELNKYSENGVVKEITSCWERQANHQAINRTMLAMLKEFKKLKEDNQGNEEILDFLSSLFLQTKANEVAIDKREALKLTPYLKHQVDKVLALKGKREEDLKDNEKKFLSFFDEFTQGEKASRFSYLVHPIIGQLITDSIATNTSPSIEMNQKDLSWAQTRIADSLGLRPWDLNPNFSQTAGRISPSTDKITRVIGWAYHNFLNRVDGGVSDPERQRWIDQVKRDEITLWDAVEEISQSEEAKSLLLRGTQKRNGDRVNSAYDFILGRPAGPDADGYRERAARGGTSEVKKIAKEIYESSESCLYQSQKLTAGQVNIPSDIENTVDRKMEELQDKQIDNSKQGKTGTPFRDARNALLEILADNAPHGLWTTPEGAKLKRLVQRAREYNSQDESDTVTTFSGRNQPLTDSTQSIKSFAGALNIPYQAESAVGLSYLPSIYRELLNHVAKNNPPIVPSPSQKEALQKFLTEGQLDKFIEALFQREANEKSSPLFKSAVEFLAGEHPELKRLFTEMSDNLDFQKETVNQQYQTFRSNFRESLLANKPNLEELAVKDLSLDEQKQLMALMILDEWGLKGVTARDQAQRPAREYDLSVYFDQLKKEAKLLTKLCETVEPCRRNPTAGKKKIEGDMAKEAQDFIGHYTGLTPKIRQTLLERKLVDPHLKILSEIQERYSNGKDLSGEDIGKYREALDKLKMAVGEKTARELSINPNLHLSRIAASIRPKDPLRQIHYFNPITASRTEGLSEVQSFIPGTVPRPQLQLDNDTEKKDYKDQLTRFAGMSEEQERQVKRTLEIKKEQREINYRLASKLKSLVLRVAREGREDAHQELAKLFDTLNLISPNTNSDLGILLAAYQKSPKDSKARTDLLAQITNEAHRLLMENTLIRNDEPPFFIKKSTLDHLFDSLEIANIKFEDPQKITEDQNRFVALESEQDSLVSNLGGRLNVPENRIRRILATRDDVERAKEAQNLSLSLAQDSNAALEGFRRSLSDQIAGSRGLNQLQISPELMTRMLGGEFKLPRPADANLKSVIDELNKMGLEYDPIHNRLTLLPSAKLGKKEDILKLLRQMPDVSMRIQVEGGREITLSRRNAVKAFEDAILRRGMAYGVSPMDSRFDFGTGAFNDQNTAEKFRHKWFMVSDQMAARALLKTLPNGQRELQYELKPVNEIQSELKGSLKQLETLRADIIRNNKDAASLKRAWRNIGDEMLGSLIHLFDSELAEELDSNNSIEKVEARRLDRALLNLENFIKGFGSIPIPGTQLKAQEYGSQVVRGVRQQKNKEEIASMDAQTRNVLNIRDGVLMVATLPFGGPIRTAGKSGWRLWAANVLNKSLTVSRMGKAATVTLNELRVVKALENIAKTGNMAQRLASKSTLVLLRGTGAIPGAIRHGMVVAGTFQGITATGKAGVELWKIQYGEKYIQERLEAARANPAGWKKHKVHPSELEQFKNRDTKTEVKELYEKALNEYNIETQLDLNGDGYIDMLHEDTSDIGYTDNRLTRITDRVFNADEFGHFIGSAQFFANLHLAGHGTGALGARFIAGKPIVEMPIAATLGNLQNYFLRPQAWKERRKALEEKYKREGKTYTPRSASAELWEVLLEDAKENAISGAVFSTAIGVNSRIMGAIGLTNPGLRNQLMGTAGFMASDMLLKEATHWGRHGQSQFAGMTNAQYGETMLDHLSTAAYIGWGSSRGFLNRAQLKSQQESLLKLGVEEYKKEARKEIEDSIRKANKVKEGEALNEAQKQEVNESVHYHLEGILRSLDPKQYTKANPQLLTDIAKWRAEKLDKAYTALKQIRDNSPEGSAVKTAAQEIENQQRELQKILDSGAWNRVADMKKALTTIDQQVEKIREHYEAKKRELEPLQRERDRKLRTNKEISEAERRAVTEKEAELALLNFNLMDATRAVTHMREFSGAIERPTAILSSDSTVFEAQFGNLSEAKKAIEQQKSKREFVNPLIDFLAENGVVDLRPDEFGRPGIGTGLLSRPGTPGTSNFPNVHRAAVDTVVAAYRNQASTNIQRQQLLQVLETLAPEEAQKLVVTPKNK